MDFYSIWNLVLKCFMWKRNVIFDFSGLTWLYNVQNHQEPVFLLVLCVVCELSEHCLPGHTV